MGILGSVSIALWLARRFGRARRKKIPSLRKPKTDPHLSMPGYEVYGEVKQIMSLWRLILASLISLVLGVGAWIDVPQSLSGLAFFGAFALAAATFFGFYLRSRRMPVAIKHDQENLLITGIVDSGVLVASRVEFASPTSLYIERQGQKLASKKMALFFASAEDTRKVSDWLTTRVAKYKTPPLPS
jgi:hypothetical protein